MRFLITFLVAVDPVLLRGDVVLDPVLRDGHLAGGPEESGLPLAVPGARLAASSPPPGLYLLLHRRRVSSTNIYLINLHFTSSDSCFKYIFII